MTIRRRVAESTLVQMRVADDLLARIDNACVPIPMIPITLSGVSDRCGSEAA